MNTSSIELGNRELAYYASLGSLAAEPAARPAHPFIALGQAELAYYASLGAFNEPAVHTSSKTVSKKARFAKTDVITIVTRQHKMKEGAVNLRRFMAIEDGHTVEEVHQFGIDNGYLAYYVRNGLISIGC